MPGNAENDMMAGSLSQRRRHIERHRDRVLSGDMPASLAGIDSTISGSWKRSARRVTSDVHLAPLADDHRTSHDWQNSLLERATQAERDDLDRLVFEGEMVAAIADPAGRLLWTSASSFMQSRAESVNFCAGGIWHESAVGTNAVGLALEVASPVTVFSSEHMLSAVHDWVCYAAPIIQPDTGRCLGVLDLSTTWEHYTPMGQSAVAGIARSIAARLPAEPVRAELEIHALGQACVRYRGKPLTLTPRQLEVLCLLALNPQGLTLNALHASLYGDLDISLSTLKAELSRLRKLLGGQIGSRPYRLQLPIWADFIEVWNAFGEGRMSAALQLCRGALLPHSIAPEIEQWRHCIDAMISRTLQDCDDPSILLEQLKSTGGSEPAIHERLRELLD